MFLHKPAWAAHTWRSQRMVQPGLAPAAAAQQVLLQITQLGAAVRQVVRQRAEGGRTARSVPGAMSARAIAATPGRRREFCHFAASPSPFGRCSNRDGEGMSAQWQPRRRLSHTVLRGHELDLRTADGREMRAMRER